ncbi:vancomycin permeability regulator SanA [Friedmanniella endophytica]|uniref:Vancomycin permeability regulator SanA n=1 Tax=Microlunatus kandeliicorticis TaxID=1759536 RepID=A0A7W3IQM7_9ACTN|nr:ElyC/SanA/YdcF family protein [Microlunatus kandeliicorticis]MBA8793459.1 vancomycin permeability regulator SanA [Microlunatus kandeliicorticis]
MSPGRRALLLFGAAAGSVVGAAAAGLAGSVIMVRLLARGRVLSEAEVPARGVGLVLGAQVYPSGRPSRFLAARLELARRLFAQGRLAVIIVSGDRRAPEYDEPAAMRHYLINVGVPAERIVIDGGGLDTFDSCHRARHVFGVRRLTVVSQTYHLPRAVATARALGLDAVGVGDRTVRGGEAWRRGAVRDQIACVKTVLDLLGHLAGLRDPSGTERSDAVREALGR